MTTISSPSRTQPPDLPKSKSQIPKANSYLLLALSVLLLDSFMATTHIFVTGNSLVGVGYREQELQLPKGTLFASETPTGVQWASFAGGTNIYIQGDGFEENPQNNRIFLQSQELSTLIPSFPLTEDDAFASNPMIGKLVYRLPSLHELFGVPEESLNSYDTMTFTLQVQTGDDEMGFRTLECGVKMYCQIVYRRLYTPIIYELSPPVVYLLSETGIWFDPRSTTSLIKDLPADDLPFIQAKINNRLIDYYGYVSAETTFNQFSKNLVRGLSGDQPVGISNNLTMLWEIGLSKILASQATHCSYDNSTCYISKTVPVIYNISANEGYYTGGQYLTVKGYGFSKGTIDTKVDGVNCQVVNRKEEEFTCRLDAASSVSTVDVPKVGGPGIRRTLVNGTSSDTVGWGNLLNANLSLHPQWEIEDSVSMQLESPINIDNQYGQIFKGWFVPPTTARYRFYMACDDSCKLYFNNQTGISSNPTNILNVGSYSLFRQYWLISDGQTRISEWQTLNQGESYYIEAQHVEYGGSDHLSVAVEIEQSQNKGHFHMMKEIQKLTIQVEDNKDTLRLNITNIDTGLFIVNFLNPTTNTWTQSNPISASSTSTEAIRQAVSPYYWSILGSDVNVQIKLYDSNGDETTNSTLVVKKSIIIQAQKLLSGPSVSNVLVAKQTTKSIITVEKPRDLQVSSPPLDGKFVIQCTLPNGVIQNSLSISTQASAQQVEWSIMRGCTFYHDKIQVFENQAFPYYQNGRSWFVRFIGVNEDVAPLQLVSDTTTPLTGNNITLTTETTVPFSSNLFYDPVPFEFLRTYETQPQVLVTVNGEPAVCHGLQCHYKFIQPEGQITSFTYTESTKMLVINGVNLPDSVQEVQKIEFAHSTCSLLHSVPPTSTQIECSLDYQPTCGDYLPILTSIYGKIPVASGVSQRTILGVVSSATPISDLNLLGRDNITISGTNLPRDIASNTFSILFNDAAKTSCVVVKSYSNQLVCLTSPFDASLQGQTLQMTIVINGQTVANSLQFTLKSSIKSGITLVPSSASPVLKTKLDIVLDSDFPFTITRPDFSVNVTSKTNSSYFRQLNVIGANDSTKTLTVMFGGALSGNYDVYIRHANFGLLKTTGLILNVGATVTSISPLTGSIYGGTTLTITGTNFGSLTTDNPIQISYNGGVGSTDCFVKSSTPTLIKCMIDPTVSFTNGKQGEVVVFLKTSEEATCVAANCNFVFSDQVAVIDQIQTVWDSTINKWTVVATGSSFTGTTDTTRLEIGGVVQQTQSVSSTQAIFIITNVSSSVLPELQIFFDSGVPKYNVLKTGYQISPKLVSVTPNQGSMGGTLVLINVQGVGTTSTLASSTSSPCASIQVVQYGLVFCQTKTGEIASNSISQLFPCSNSDTSLCNFVQSASISYPRVTGASITGANTLVLYGSNFLDSSISSSSYLPQVELAKVRADSVTVDSATQVTATFSKGLPPLKTTLAPVLRFTHSTTGVSYFSEVVYLLSNPLSVSTSSSSLSCSFAGGCQYDLSSPGLASLLKGDPNSNYIQVCGNNCTYQDSVSTGSQASCKLPSLSTVYSNSNFKISVDGVLKSGRYFGTAPNPSIVFDGDWLVTSNDAKSDCSVGVEFKQGFVGLLSLLKFFLPDGVKTSYIGYLKFQGSNDNVTYNDIYTVDQLAKSGWNYVYFGDGKDLPTPRYRFYRMKGSVAGACKINEVELQGVETIDDNNPTYQCTPKLIINGTDSTVSLNPVTYSGALTPKLTSIQPRYGTVTGGEEVTFSGSGFSTNKADIKITIDGIDCPLTSATATEIKCITGKRPGLKNSTLDISINGLGSVALGGRLFRYVSYWSSDTTWGGEFAPMEGESLYVPPGLNLLVDIDRSPEVNAVIVEGSLIFAPHSDPDHQRFFDAHYIFVNGGTLEVGTEEFPYTSKLTITMHGTDTDPYLPTYGNKCIGIRYGNLTMIGQKREPTWTVLESTAELGSNQITLRQAVDWKVGEHISVASTSYEGREAEEKVIVAIDRTNPNKPVLTLDSPFLYRHFAATETYGGVDIDMRAEVGLLTRNIVFRGDDYSVEAQYGGIIFLHSFGDDSLVAKLAYTEFTNTGQAFKKGRYTVHFHMIGSVFQSYAKGNSVHQAFNRAFTIHGTQYLRIEENVVFDSMGHSIFIEDAVERHNFIYRNLVMMTKRSFSLLNTDQTPACFWLTNPNNDYIENHAAGSDRYSYWYDLKPHSIGPSASLDVCPENEPVGRFENNHAHSNGRYGLRIFHNMVPRTYPCKPIVYDNTRPDDPYWQNPPLTARFVNLTSWKNQRNGAIAEKVGDVRFIGFKTADNLLAGIEFSLTDQTGDNMARIENATIVGRSAGNREESLMLADPHGIITPRTENFTVIGVKFYNFDWNLAAAIGSCSHCFHPAATDSGAREVRFQGLQFNNVLKKIRYQLPWRAIYKDLDGSLTGKGPNSWATFYYGHHNISECEWKEDEYNGVVCDSSIQMRRLAFSDYLPKSLFIGQTLRILPIDDNLMNSMTADQKTAYYLNTTNYGKLLFKDKSDPSNGWAFPIATGHKYKVHWGNSGLDFEKMTLQLSDRWEEGDRSIYLVHNFTDVRAKIEVKWNKQVVSNNTLPTTNQADWTTGMNVVYNQSEVRELHFVINGKNSTKNKRYSTLVFTGSRCVGSCMTAIKDVPVENGTRLWSDPESWPSGSVPQEGEDVDVYPGWNMIMDLNNTPVYRFVRINGRVTFKEGMDIQFNAKHIFVRAGELLIGNETHPCLNKVVIKLYGEKNFESMVYDNAIEAGNKLIANVGKIKIFGKQRTKNMVRLLNQVFSGDTQILVEPGLDLVNGDQLGLLPTSFVSSQSDFVTVQSYDSVTGIVTLTEGLKFYHWGASQSTASKYNGVDIRGEVLILTRNVKIVGEDIESWGAQFVTSDTIEEDLTLRNGITVLDSVEFYNCSQVDTFKAAIRWEAAVNGFSAVTNCSFHNGLGWGVNMKTSSNLIFSNNLVFNFRTVGVNIETGVNITAENNVIGGLTSRIWEVIGMIVDKEGGFCICSYETDDKCKNVYVRHNIVGGARYAGFISPGHKCGDYQTKNFFNNTAHSIDGQASGLGAWIFPDLTQPTQITECIEASYFNAYKTRMQGIFFMNKAKLAIFSRMTMIDNGLGMSSHVATAGASHGQGGVKVLEEYEDHTSEFNDNIIYGDTEAYDCPKDIKSTEYCNIINKKFQIMPALSTFESKDPHITSAVQRPPHKLMTEGAWGGKAVWNRNRFVGFKSKTLSGRKNFIIGGSNSQSDYTPIQEMNDNIFDNCEWDSIATLIDPPNSWANIDDCGNFPCTAPKNVMLDFRNTKWVGNNVPFYATSDFQIVGNNSGFIDNVDTCLYQTAWNAYFCKNQDLGLLIFESQDEERWNRAIHPVYYSKQDSKIINKMNSMMDHVWDGFYTGLTRLPRFPGLVVTPRGSIYDVIFTGTPPQTMLFELKHVKRTAGMTIRIAYPDAISQQVKVNGEYIEMNQWDKTINQYGEVRQRFCGENRYIGVKNILEFYITQGCRVYVSPRNAIQTQVRMEWTLENFYAKGGTTTIADRICAVLGIHASQLKIVSVYEGSLVLNYEISSDDGSQSALDAIEKQQTQLYATGQMDLGAPILDVQSSRLSANTTSSSSSAKTTQIVKDGVVTAAGFEPIKITITSTNQNSSSSNTFNPNIKISQETQTITNTQTVQETIINKTPNVNAVYEAIEVEESNKGTTILITVILLVFVVIGVVTARYYYLKKKHEDIKMKAKGDKTKLEMEMTAKKIISQSEQDLNSKAHHENSDDMQYDAIQDFNIFDRNKTINLRKKIEGAEILAESTGTQVSNSRNNSSSNVSKDESEESGRRKQLDRNVHLAEDEEIKEDE